MPQWEQGRKPGDVERYTHQIDVKNSKNRDLYINIITDSNYNISISIPESEAFLANDNRSLSSPGSEVFAYLVGQHHRSSGRFLQLLKIATGCSGRFGPIDQA